MASTPGIHWIEAAWTGLPANVMFGKVRRFWHRAVGNLHRPLMCKIYSR